MLLQNSIRMAFLVLYNHIMTDIYITYWDAILIGIKDPEIAKKLQGEIDTRKEGLKQGLKCAVIAKCGWPFCRIDRRFKKGYCAP